MVEPEAAKAGAITPLGWLAVSLRLVVMLAWLTLCVVLYYVWRALRRANPWPPVFLGGLAWIAGVDITISGARARQGAFLLANHVSWIDIPAIASANSAAFIAHDGLAANPLLRWLCLMNDTIFIARHQRASVGQQIEQVRGAVASAIERAGALAIFPEGTTSDGTSLLPFKSSLLSALDPLPHGLAVHPLWLDYGAETTSIAWIDQEPGITNFLRILARGRPLALTVHILPPLAGPALMNRKTIATAAREAILATMSESRAHSFSA